MSKKDLTNTFEYVAKPGETVIRDVRVGYRGVDMGAAYVIEDRYEGKIDYETVIPEELREAEADKLDEAFTRLTGTLERMLARADKVGVQINDVYEAMLKTELKTATGHQSTKLEGLKTKIIRSGQTAEAVVHDFYNSRIQTLLRSMENLKEEDGSVSDAVELLQKPLGQAYFFLNTLVNSLRGHPIHSLDRIRGNSERTSSLIPVKRRFEVGDLGFLKDDSGHGTKVHSLIRCEGTSGDHTEVIAKGVRIAVANISETKFINIKDGQNLIVDGRLGIIIKDPSPETVAEYQREIQSQEKTNKILTGRSVTEKLKGLSPHTLDGQKIKISANAGFVDEMYAATLCGARSIGLYRSEIDIKSRYDLDRAGTPYEKFAEIYDALAKMSTKGDGKVMPVTIRTPDLVADKSIKGKNEDDINQFIQDCVHGIVTAQKQNPEAKFRIMFPMIETTEQFNAMRNRVHEIAKKSEIDAPECGAMIETRSAIDEMKTMDADFYSIGTNDLIPGLLGYDRYTESEAYDPTDPAVIDALTQIQQNATEQNKENRLSICGDVASQPMYFAMLVGLGYNHLSTGPGEIPFHKELVRRIDTRAAQELVEKMKLAETREEREELLHNFNEDYLGLGPTGKFDMEWQKPPTGAASYDHDNP